MSILKNLSRFVAAAAAVMLMSVSVYVGTYAVTGGNITIEDGIVTAADKTVTSAVIPSEFGGEKVTEIGQSAFYKARNNLKSVSLPDTLTKINSSAFKSCSELTEISLPPALEVISDSAFKGCSGITQITIPASVANVENSAFSGCSGLKTVTVEGADTQFVFTASGSDSFYGLKDITFIGSKGSNIEKYVDAADPNHERNFTFEATSADTVYAVSGKIISPLTNETSADIAFTPSADAAKAYSTKVTLTRAATLDHTEGTYSVNLPAGIYSMSVTSDTHKTYTTTVTVSNAAVTVTDITLEPTVFTLSGTVTTPAKFGGTCTISFSSGDKEIAKETADISTGTASYSIDNFKPGYYRVKITANRHIGYEKTENISSQTLTTALRAIGDANGDNKLNNDDVKRIIRLASGLNTAVAAEDIAAADINGNSRHDIGDAILLVKYLNGDITEY